MRARTRERTTDRVEESSDAQSRRRRNRGRSNRKGSGSSAPSTNREKGDTNRSGEGRNDRGQNAPNKGSKGKGRKRPSQGNRRNRRPQRAAEAVRFWGDAAELPSPSSDIRITEDPAAVPRSLGPPPLPGHEAIAEHYFAAIYDRAVTTACALAAAGGLIDPDALTNGSE